MSAQNLVDRIEAFRIELAKPHANSRKLHDDLQALISVLEANRVPVPQDLREAAEELQAEVLEDFYDNLPV